MLQNKIIIYTKAIYLNGCIIYEENIKNNLKNSLKIYWKYSENSLKAIGNYKELNFNRNYKTSIIAKTLETDY